jgi:hypothetical protein
MIVILKKVLSMVLHKNYQRYNLEFLFGFRHHILLSMHSSLHILPIGRQLMQDHNNFQFLRLDQHMRLHHEQVQGCHKREFSYDFHLHMSLNMHSMLRMLPNHR